jgi:hypothetical protein
MSLLSVHGIKELLQLHQIEERRALGHILFGDY